MDLFISGGFFPPHIMYTPVERIVVYYERIHKAVAFIIV